MIGELIFVVLSGDLHSDGVNFMQGISKGRR